jgi:hypothetical protein
MAKPMASFAAEIPEGLSDMDDLMTRYGRWAMSRWTPSTCGSAEGMYRPERGSVEDRRNPPEVIMPPGDALAVQRALSEVPEKYRIVLQYLYVPQRLPAHVMLARARIPPKLSQERQIDGLRMLKNIYLRNLRNSCYKRDHLTRVSSEG